MFACSSKEFSVLHFTDSFYERQQQLLDSFFLLRLHCVVDSETLETLTDTLIVLDNIIFIVLLC